MIDPKKITVTEGKLYYGQTLISPEPKIALKLEESIGVRTLTVIVSATFFQEDLERPAPAEQEKSAEN